ncbi:transcriptional activator NhaR [Pseudomaricurvus alkylphenolicus]|jgi:LysR family transcriptional activator of nhaA|uniref:transcriptional activator NhaR n=1 Tax=Pseudomaricurvus alkylphenolicus TaxID=1306991 RepID=UPI00141F525F|nr:transcriptional activator NhaR [Pseudomaricurvus alkylphenolicus]NIB38785.1 transcriptional activator NhaR [Pseudomaricurvus alkylphenolicus]
MVQQLNYNHLRYFYAIAKEGSIAKAAETLHVSPQTISGQISVFEDYLGVQLFERKGKRLVMNETGHLVFSYAEDIFALGAELQQTINSRDASQPFIFNVGVTDVIPKMLAVNILKNAFTLEGPIKLVCREGDYDSLLSELALNRLDLILSDRPLAPNVPIRAYNHPLGECGLSFYADGRTARKLRNRFPESLHQRPFLMCGDKSNQKVNLNSWFDQQQIYPEVVGEFDDSAMLKYFGQSGYGVFCTPSIIEQHVTRQYGVSVIGRTEQVMERFYAISPERKLVHPGVKLLVDAAKEIFAREKSN